jgi:multidrug resistance efflux pump
MTTVLERDVTTALKRLAQQPHIVPETGAALRSALRWSRLVKLGGAFAVLGLGAYAVLQDVAEVTTDNAVVSAYTVALRTPIDGMVSEKATRVGDRVNRGDAIAEITNVRVDDQRLVDLREHLMRVRADAATIASQKAALVALREDLEQRSRAYIEATSARLTGAITEAALNLQATEARRGQAQRTLARRSQLNKAGFASIADLDSAQSDFDVASRQVSAQQGHLDSLQVERQAVVGGVVSQPGSNDVAYSRQRADEVTIRIDELDREKALAVSDASETAARLQSEEARIARMRKAPLASPISGIVWKLNAQDGERLGTGETVAQVVDCDQTFILATLPQNRFPDVAVGGRVEYRLSGDVTKRYGRVVSIAGDLTGGDANLAAVPINLKSPTVTARVALDPSPGECLVGRTARVLFPSSGGGFFGHLFDRFR